MNVFGKLFRPRTLVCQQAVELVTAYLDGALSRTERARFEAHIADCPNCRTYLEQIRATIAVTGTVAVESLDSQVQADLITLYRSWKNG